MDFLRLIRYKNLLMVLLTMVLTKYALIDSIFFNSHSLKKHTLTSTLYLGISNTDYQFILLAFSILLITAGGYIINDIFDIKTDKINKPLKLIIDTSISIKKGWFLYYLTTFLGLFLGIYISVITANKEYSILFLGTILLLFLYSKYLKKTLLIGNLLVSTLLGLVIFITLLFNEPKGYSSNFIEAISNFSLGIKLFLTMIIYIGFSILTNFIREIIKDIEDVNGDLKIKAKTLPILFGRKRASKVAFFFSSVLLIFLVMILKSLQNETILFVYGNVFILLPLLYFMYKLWISETKKDFSRLSNLIKIIMLLGILSMILFNIK
jgi:4-hydroxybenzoate polyprenyltransferase